MTTICLNMIVKNESHLIVDSLKKLVKKVKFDYWCISDTGSTDGTQTLIRDFFASEGIAGELVEHEWQDFGYNRTKALELAYDKTDYLFIFDADDELCGDFVLPNVMTADAYRLNFGSENGTSYSRVQIVNNRQKWRYRGVLHEYIENAVVSRDKNETIEGNYYVVSGKTGSRSLDAQKYIKDAIILKDAHAKALASNDELYIRYAFYCANSYFDSGHYESAIEWYKTTLNQPNWSQEKYVACLRIYDAHVKLGTSEEGIFYLVESTKYDKQRVECVFNLVRYYSLQHMPELATLYYGLVKDWYETQFLQTVSLSRCLFVYVPIYHFFLPYNMIDLNINQLNNAFDDCFIHFYIIFKKKYLGCSDFLINRVLYNFTLCVSTFTKNKRLIDPEFQTELTNYLKLIRETRPTINPELIKKIDDIVFSL